MAYKYSKGPREFGDIKYEDDAAETQIDFEDDFIALKTGGNSVLVVSGSLVGINHPAGAPLSALDVHQTAAVFTSMPNDLGAGETIYFGTGTLTAGKLYYLHTDGVWTEADADTEASGADQLLGLAQGSGAAATVGVLLRGYFDATTYLSNFSTGKAVYMSTTAASMDTTAPAGAADIVRIVGYCTTTANVIYFCPSNDWVELS
jgi:hypothetical protein